MSISQVCKMPGIGVGYFNKNTVANVISWSKSMKVGLRLDYFEDYDAFVLYATNSTGWTFHLTARACTHSKLEI